MKLWVDDIRNAPDDTWTVARTVTSAINFIALYRSQLDEVSLDHDISIPVDINGTVRPYPSPETFLPVAYYLAEVYRREGEREKPVFIAPLISVHSANPAGADMIASVLSEYGGLKAHLKPMGAANRLEMEV